MVGSSLSYESKRYGYLNTGKKIQGQSGTYAQNLIRDIFAPYPVYGTMEALLLILLRFSDGISMQWNDFQST